MDQNYLKCHKLSTLSIDPLKQFVIGKLSNNIFTDFTDHIINTSILKYENKIDSVTLLVANDVMDTTYIQQNLDVGDMIEILSKEDNSLIFKGVIVEIVPDITNRGSNLRIESYAFPAIGLNRMRAREVYNNKKLRELLVAPEVAPTNDFPYTEFYTEINPSDINVYWDKNGTVTLSSVSSQGSYTPKYGSYFILASDCDDNVNIWFPKTGSPIHGFNLFIESNSSPSYDCINEVWKNIPYIDFWIYRAKVNGSIAGNIELQFKIDDTNYIRFRLTDQDHSGHNINLIPMDEGWIHLRIPVGSKWGESHIYAYRIGDSNTDITDDSNAKVKTWMAIDDPTQVGHYISEYVGWDTRASTGGGASDSSWENILAINFFLTGEENIYVGIDDLKFLGFSNPYSIITDDVKKLFHLTASAYAELNTDYIVDDPTELSYFQFVYEQATRCLMDILNLDSGVQYPNVGKHWIVTADGKLCIAPIGNHNVSGIDNNHIVESVWATNSKYTEDNPLVLGADIIATNFAKKEAEANFVIINGVFQTPKANDWMQSLDYWYFYSFGNVDDLVVCGDAIIGPNSLGINPVTRTITEKFYIDLDPYIDINLLSDAKLTFWIKSQNLQTVEVRVYTDLYDVVNPPNDDGAGNYLWHQDITKQLQVEASILNVTSKGWIKIDIPLKTGEWNVTNYATWSKSIKRIYFRIVGGISDGYVYIDGLNINGQTLRATYSQVNVFKHGVKTKLINESLVAGNSLSSILDTLDYLAVAEVLKSMTTPWVGTVQIELDYTLLAGQIVYVLSPPFGDNPKQFRLLWVRHDISTNGAFSTLYLTDDLKNSYARDPSEVQTLMIKTINPDMQNRDFARLKLTGMNFKTMMVKMINIDSL